MITQEDVYPTKPFNILTINGGGLQVISSLSILSQLLNILAAHNGIPPEQALRPCDVFDTIVGIGTNR